ncbi:TRAP transporter small permease [Chromohalobacter sp. 296-RDG]|uniref:TRAP transporter small permease subunit n=1 Tax=Chromohalobacter sp. 296-RDG TaxID=2994062 RepID=UPI0024691330|nr:TRAP transporter small permease [Chromohalobacter sp. 296-RDG]
MSNETPHNNNGSFSWDSLPAWLFMIVIVATTYEVVARYFFHSPTIWANELSLYVCAIAYIYSGVYVMRRDAHLRISILYDMAPPRVQRILDVLQCFFIVGFSLTIGYFGAPEAWKALIHTERFGTAWNAPIPMTIKPLLVLCGLAMAVLAVRNLLRRLRDTEKEERP